jgi:hypothetical protein
MFLFAVRSRVRSAVPGKYGGRAVKTFDEALDTVLLHSGNTEGLVTAFEAELEDSDFIRGMCEGMIELWNQDPRNGVHFAQVFRMSVKASFLTGLAVGREMEKS